LLPSLLPHSACTYCHLRSFPTRRSSDLRYEAELVRPQGRAGSGIAGMKLVDDDFVLSFTVVPAAQLDEARVVTVTETDDDMLDRSEEHTSELQSRFDLVCRLLLEKKKTT